MHYRLTMMVCLSVMVVCGLVVAGVHSCKIVYATKSLQLIDEMTVVGAGSLRRSETMESEKWMVTMKRVLSIPQTRIETQV